MVKFRIQLVEDSLGHQKAVDIEYKNGKLDYEFHYLSHTYSTNKVEVMKLCIIHGIDDPVEMRVNQKVHKITIPEFLDIWVCPEEDTMKTLDFYERISS